MVRPIFAEKVRKHDGKKSDMVVLHISDERPHASGVFSKVYRARLRLPEERLIAIKKTWSTIGHRNSDLHFLRHLSHPHIVQLLYFFHTTLDKNKTCECLVLEFLPFDLASVQKATRPQPMDLLDIKMYTWQMFCALGYLCELGIAHRDVKPANLLCDPQSGIVKVGDFGSAKRLVRGEKSTCYQVTRYYRAPELLFESVYYTPAIDIWAGACVLGELMIGNVMLAGRNTDDQTRLIIELFGIPSNEDCIAMGVARPPFASRPARGIRNLFPDRTSMDALQLLESLMRYAPDRRPRGTAILNHRFFDDLRAHPPPVRTNGRPLPQVFSADQSAQSNANEASSTNHRS
uniref:Protein kinase domain-containing protein n=1 Tax=Plectus sambesii TaxID=2011161 RepID=A0A914XDN0_9BILA